MCRKHGRGDEMWIQSMCDNGYFSVRAMGPISAKLLFLTKPPVIFFIGYKYALHIAISLLYFIRSPFLFDLFSPVVHLFGFSVCIIYLLILLRYMNGRETFFQRPHIYAVCQASCTTHTHTPHGRSSNTAEAAAAG